MSTIDLSGKSALVLGASKGIGSATALHLAECEASVVLAARSADQIEAVAREISDQGGKVVAQTCDVSDFSAVQQAVAKSVQTFGQLDILVNNAGVIEPLETLMDSDPGVWAQAVDINLKGVYHGMRAALPVMVAQGRGTIVNMSSGAANSALVGWSHYCATKAAAKKLTEVAHKEVGDLGVRVVGLSPGTVATDMMAKIRDAQINPVSHLDWASHSPSEWAARAVAFLCGPEGREFAGTDFSIKTEEGRRRVGLL